VAEVLIFFDLQTDNGTMRHAQEVPVLEFQNKMLRHLQVVSGNWFL
jgi:hypothetical protein